MQKITKKIRERFNKAIPKFQKVLKIAQDQDVNESDTVDIITDIFGEVFGYNKYVEVTSEYAIRGTFCDLAIRIDDKVQFLIEVKAVGIELKERHLRQVVQYGSNHGIPWVILTNGIDWRVYKIRFEKPIAYDLVADFDFLTLNPKNPRSQNLLFIITKKGLAQNFREDFYDKIQSVNRFVIGSLILGDPVLRVIRRELKKFFEGVKIDVDEVDKILRTGVLKRDVVQGETAQEAQKRVSRFYKKQSSRRRKKKIKQKNESLSVSSNASPVSVTEKLLGDSEKSTKK